MTPSSLNSKVFALEKRLGVDTVNQEDRVVALIDDLAAFCDVDDYYLTGKKGNGYFNKTGKNATIAEETEMALRFNRDYQLMKSEGQSAEGETYMVPFTPRSAKFRKMLEKDGN